MTSLANPAAAPPPHGSHRRRLPGWLIFAVAFALTAGVRIYTLGRQNLWLDELATAWAIGLDVAGLLRDRLAEGHSPLYYLILKGLGLAGASDFMLRLPSAVFDGLAAGLLALAARRLAGATGAAAMAILYAFTALLVHYGQEARPHALLNLFLVVAFLSAMTLIRAPRAAVAAFSGRRARRGAKARMRLAGLGFVLGMAGAAWTLPLGWVAMAVLQAGILVEPALIRRRRFLALRIGLSLIAWLAALPIILALLPAITDGVGAHWSGDLLPFTAGNALSALSEAFGWAVPGDADRFLGGPFAIAGPLLFLAMAATAAAMRWRRPQLRLALWTAAAGLLALLGLGAAQNLAVAGWFLPVLPPFLLVAAVGAVLWWQMRPTAIITLAVAASVILQGLDAGQAVNKTSWRPVVTLLATSRDPIAAAVDRGELQAMLQRYLPGTLPLTTVIVPDGTPMAPALLPAYHHGDTAWALSEGEPPDLSGLPASAVVCTWQHEDYWIAAIAPNRSALPDHLRDCVPENGPLLESSGR